VLVALGIQHAMRMRNVVICGLSGSAIFFHIISQRGDFRKTFTEHILYDFVWNFFYSKKNWRRYDQQCILLFMLSIRYSCPILM